jgi:uncharacterized heparinase superfamily protein
MIRFIATARHLSARQLTTRAARIAERLWWRVTKPAVPQRMAPAIAPHQPLWRDLSPDPAALSRASEIAAGRFTFLNETRVHPSWAEPEASQLWRFHLHYFDYAHDLAVAGEARLFRELARSWIAANRVFGGDGWHPYTVSLRIVNWCEALMVFGDDPEIRSSIHAQARFLARHLERDVRGNHLLENARALIRAGVFFAAGEWIDLGTAILREEIPEQVLADGGHFERSPGYHVRVMQTLGDVARLIGAPWLPLARMREFLETITPPGGRLPLLKDTTDTTEFRPLTGGARESRWLEASGFAVMRDDPSRDFLIADFGRVCPDYLPAHAHADMFSFELTIGGKPAIVDSGVYEYATGEWRAWFRSTAAHNTVEVDGRDQSEMWGSFRVGRRARQRKVLWTDTATFTSISGEHDGYAPVLHHRSIIAIRNCRIWMVFDRVWGAPGHRARSFLHLHPDAVSPSITAFGGGFREAEGWYSEAFGVKRRNRVLVLDAVTPAWFGYVVSAEGDVAVTAREDGDNCVVDVASPTWRGSVRAAPALLAPLVSRNL